jgi:murein endopeptidase
MSWRPDEIWLDTEVLWFRERSSGHAATLVANAPSFFGVGRARISAITIPNGLAESRRRRAELRRRRTVRRTRAAALAIGPAMMLALAAPRISSGSRTGEALLEDPPSQTLRPGAAGAGAAGAAPARGVAERAASGAASSAKPDRKAATPFPKVQWNEGTSHGLPFAGYLTGGTQLPVEGVDWVTWNPVRDSVPNKPNRLYGNERTIRTIISVVTAHRAAHPNAPRVVVGDISFRGGGPMEQHRSHQNGLDVDVYYPRLDGRLRAPLSTAQIDRRLAQDLLDRFVAAGAQKVFVGYHSGLRGPGGVVTPYPNHENHMHVRFRAPRR